MTPPDLVEEPAVSAVEPSIDVGDRSSVAAEVKEIAPEVPLPKLPESTVQARAEAVSIGHCVSHFPKCPLCDICKRSSNFVYTCHVSSTLLACAVPKSRHCL